MVAAALTTICCASHRPTACPARGSAGHGAMNPLDWSLIGGPLPVILLAGALLSLAWLAAGRNAAGQGWLRRGARGGSAGGAVSVRWLAIGVPLIVALAAGVIAVLTWLINNV